MKSPIYATRKQSLRIVEAEGGEAPRFVKQMQKFADFVPGRLVTSGALTGPGKHRWLRAAMTG